MATFVDGIDVSVWQDDNSTPQMMNFETARKAGARFVFIKASQATRVDEDFILNWANAKKAGLLRGAYHYLDWTTDAVTQARHFSNVLRSDPGELPPVLDYEARFNVPTRAVASTAASNFLKEVETNLGKRPMIYTSPGYWNEFGTTDPKWNQYPLWIANYQVTTPKIPVPWTNWHFWQYTNKGDGAKYGAESASIDLNYFNGTVDELYNFAGVPMPPPGPVPDLTGKKLRVVDGISALRVRSGPDVNSDILGTVGAGQVGELLDYVVKVMPLFDQVMTYRPPFAVEMGPDGLRIKPTSNQNLSGLDQWAKVRFVGIEGWCAVLYEGKQYMQWV